jgi:tRNA pseudouridine13 synthase
MSSPSAATFRRSAERAFGISFFFNNFRQGFVGELKTRQSDFIVREVALDGRVARLSSTLIPEDEAEIHEEQDGGSLLSELTRLIGVDSVSNLEKLVADTTDSTPKVSVVAPESKDVRKRLHALIRNCFPNLDSVSRDSGDHQGSKSIDIFRKNGTTQSQNNKSLKRPREHGNGWQRSDWPMHRPPFLHFVLYKQNIDTISAIRQLSASLGIKERNVGYAGAKDKRGYTAQFMTLFKIQPQRLQRVVQSLRGLSVGNFSFASTCLNLGDLWGNRFEIVVRGLKLRERKQDIEPIVESTESTEAVVAASLQNWAAGNCKFVNYFGRQRFGSAEADGGGTHDIGHAILEKNWTQALNLIFFPRQGEMSECLNMKKEFANGNLEGSLAAAPSFMRLEISLLKKLKECGGIQSQLAAREAIMSIPPNLRNLYVYAYQSLVWNILVSDRMRLLGLLPVEGDLVLVRQLGKTLNDSLDLSSYDEYSSLDGNPPSIDSPEEVDEQGKERILPAVRALTADDISSGSFGIEDVVMPLPGCNVQYPTHIVGASAIANLLISDGILEARNLSDASTILDDAALVASVFRSRDLRSQFSGDYRHIVTRARDLDWTLVRISPSEDVFVSDIDVMRNISTSVRVNNESAAQGQSPQSCALTMSFSLPKSSYATIAMRELMKGE